MCARRPTRPNLVGRGSEHTIPPVVARGNLAPPPASANQGQLCNLASPPLSAPSRPENPITLPTSHSPAPYPLPVCRGSSTDLLFPLPAPRFTCRLVFRQLRLRLTKINSRARSCSGRVCPVLSCPVIRSPGFYPGGSLPLESLGSLRLSLLSLIKQRPPPSPDYLPGCLSVLHCLRFPITNLSSHPWNYQPAPVRCSALSSALALLRHPPQQFPNVAWIRPNCTGQPATGAAREESHFGRLSKFSDRRRGRIALQIGTVSEASPHPPSPGYPITQPSQPAIIPPPKGPV